jgi:26S proteasome regulatory subunit N10
MKMKKSNVSIDFVAFGDLDDENTKKLQAFNENVKSGGGSYLAIIPPSAGLLSDQLTNTPILGGDGTAPRGGDEFGAEGGAGGGGGGFEFGVDPSTDPELALALRMSMEEETARQAKENKAKEEAAKTENLEGIPEESQPLLNQNGEASGSGGADGEEKKDKDEDKMDTA